MFKMKTIVWFGIVLGALSAAGKVIIAKQGQSVTTLECGVNTYSDDLEWKHEENLIFFRSNMRGIPRTALGKGDTALRSKVKKETNLEISEVKEVDAGKFTCLADRNRHEHTLLVVSVSASPSAELQLGSEVTLHCKVKGLNPPDSTVQWKRPDGSELAGTVLRSVARSDAGTWNCMFSHDGAPYSMPLEIKVQEPQTSAPSLLQNPGDVRNPTCPNCNSQPSPGNTQTEPEAVLLLGLIWWVWIPIGVGCLVVVLLLVFVIVLCKRVKRRKRKFQTMKNGRQPLKPKKYCQCDRPAAAAKPQQGRRREKPSAPPLQPLLMEGHERLIEERKDRKKEKGREEGNESDRWR